MTKRAPVRDTRPKRKAGAKSPRPKPIDTRPPEKQAQGQPLDGSKNPGGRPTEWTPERIEQLGDLMLLWSTSHTACYLETFCAMNETYPQKLSELAAKSEKFSEALKRTRAACAAHLSEATAGGEMPPAFGIFALKQHGWTDRQHVVTEGEVKQTHSGAVALTLTIDTKNIQAILNGSDKP